MKSICQTVITQVRIWDLYAKVMPLVFLMIIASLFIFNKEHIEWLFYTGVGLFGITCIIWWWWTLSTIAKLVWALQKAEKDLDHVAEEITKIRNFVNNRSA